MGNTQPKDFHWSYTDEPHASRRREMLEKHPEIRNLYGFDSTTKWIVVFWVLSQFLIAYTIRSWSWTAIFTIAYFYGAVANHALFLCMHEISHNSAFPKTWQNRALGVFANITTGVPHFSMFQRYHMDHHQYQGVEGTDTDLPTKFEGDLFTNSLLKTIFVMGMPFVYLIRPLYVKPKNPGFWEAINWSVVLGVDAAIFFTLGEKSLIYFLASSLLGSGLHPVAGHFIAEHYVWIKNQETYSYYGPLNLLTLNVGFHNEHHDFPRIPGSKLKQLHKIAPDYYNTLPIHKSWARVIYEFIVDPSVSPFSRVVRKSTKLRKEDAKDL